MNVLITLAILLIALAAAAYVANYFVAQYKLRKTKDKRDKLLEKFLVSPIEDYKGTFLVTKVWYGDNHKSSEIVTAISPAEAYEKESDDRRNLDYYIESVKRI